MEQKFAFFRENGYWIEHGALSLAEVNEILLGVAEPPRARTSGGSKDDERALPGGPGLLHRTAALDVSVYHPRVFPLVQRILGDGARLSILSGVASHAGP
jgi:hypothetical protein